MGDRRRIKLVITAIADGGNFETGESDGEASTKVIDAVVEDDMTLQRVVDECHRLLVRVV